MRKENYSERFSTLQRTIMDRLNLSYPPTQRFMGPDSLAGRGRNFDSSRNDKTFLKTF